MTESQNKITETPETIGVILDGNRRYAKENNKDVAWGHEQGLENFKNFIKYAEELGVKNIIAYAFSSENWNRSEIEVVALMTLLRRALKEILGNKDLLGKVSFIGNEERFPDDIKEMLLEVKSRLDNSGSTRVYMALSYGGKDEIVRAAKNICKNNQEITEQSISSNLDTAGIPDPEIIIRTGGEMRLSNFLMWQSAYSELFFTKTLWPAFTKAEFQSILEEYGKRQRRFGK